MSKIYKQIYLNRRKEKKNPDLPTKKKSSWKMSRWSELTFFQRRRLYRWPMDTWKDAQHHYLVLITESCPTLWNPMDCSPPSSSAHEISQARILEWVAISFSRPLTIREMQMKTTVIYHLTPGRMCIIKKITRKCWQGHGERRILVHCWWKCELVGIATMENSMEILQEF